MQHGIWGEAEPTPFGRLTNDHGERLAGIWEEVIESLYTADHYRRYRSDRKNPDILEPHESKEWHAIGPREEWAQTQLLRDIFGNPFRPVAFSPSWRTDTALSLARQMYESRDFSAMPILADALQDAGCDIEDILSHCRGPGPHVRGCWVVDLVLGKE